MSTNNPNSQESVGEPASTAHAVCHDCTELEAIFETTRPEEALELATEAAIEHGRATDHNVDEQLVDRPTTTITTGPDVEDTEVRR